MSDIAQKVFNAVEPVLKELGYELVDVEYVKRGDDMHLIVYADSAMGLSLDDCEKINDVLDGLLDELNPTSDSPYILDVCSPGLDRPFKKQRDYERNYGKEVEVKLYAPLKGKKIYEGVLLEKRQFSVLIDVGGEQSVIEDNKIVYVRPLVKFE